MLMSLVCVKGLGIVKGLGVVKLVAALQAGHGLNKSGRRNP